MAEDAPEAKAVLDKLRSALKRRGAEGIRGLARHFKIVDRSKTGVLDAEEFEQACKLNQLGLSTTDVHTLVKAFDKDGHDMVSYHELLRAVRGRLSPVRKAMVKKIFDVLDKIGGERGYLSIDDISAIYSVTKHPAVVAGKMRKEEALQEFVNSFEEVAGKITLDEWIRYYEEMSAPIESDDYFGAIMAGTWAHLKQKLPDGSKVPAVKFTSRADVELLEFKLKGTIYQKTPPNTNSRRTCELAFRHLDTNGSGVIGLDEFIKALERFGMHVSGVRPGPGGMPRETCQALFNKYDVDGSGNLSYKEFALALFKDEEPTAQQRANIPQRPTLACYKDNEWLKGSNGIFDGIGGSTGEG
jgi:Ca2+-binding EF-hand superfamily protein